MIALAMVFKLFYPRIVGHRGARVQGIDENSMAAFEFALAQHVRAVELDVRLSKDGVPVVFHDPTLERMADDPRHIAELTSVELNDVTLIHGSKIPLLAEVLGWATRHHVFLHIELKGDGVDPQVVSRVADLLKHQRHPFVISSFYPSLLLRAKALGLPVSLLWDREHTGKRSGFALAATLPWTGLHPNVALVTPLLLRMAQLENKYVCTWTVNTLAKAQTLLGMGAQSIITDRPDLLALLA